MHIMKVKINKYNILYALWGIMIFVEHIAVYSIGYKILAILFMGYAGLILLSTKSIRFIKYHWITVIFILWNCIIVFLGLAYNPDVSLNYCGKLVINLLLYVLTFSMIIKNSNPIRFFKIYIGACIASSLVILYAYRNTLFTGRIGTDNSTFWLERKYYDLFGLRLTSAGPNTIATFCSVSAILSIYIYCYLQKKQKRSEKKYLIGLAFFFFMVLTTGSRKGILFISAGCFFVDYLFGKGIYGKLKKVLIWGLLSMGAYLLTQMIPALYETIGSRLNDLFLSLIGYAVTEPSINTRTALIKYANEFFLQRPITGWGLDAFRYMFPWGQVVDNNFYEVLVSSGIIGFLIYYSYVPMILHDFYKIRQSYWTKLAVGLFMLTFIMHWGSSIYFVRSEGYTLSIVYSLFYLERKRRKVGKEGILFARETIN